jgi:hypothetical protein
MLKNYFCTTMKTLDVYVQHTSVWVVNFRSRKRHVIGMRMVRIRSLTMMVTKKQRSC